MSPCPEVLAIPKISGGREKSLVPSGLIGKDDRLWADIVTGQWLHAILSPLVRRASWSYFCPNTIECTRNPGLILGSNNSGALFCRYLFLGWWDSVQCACGLKLALSKRDQKTAADLSPEGGLSFHQLANYTLTMTWWPRYSLLMLPELCFWFAYGNSQQPTQPTREFWWRVALQQDDKEMAKQRLQAMLTGREPDVN